MDAKPLQPLRDNTFYVNYSEATQKRWDPSYQKLFHEFIEKLKQSPFPVEKLKESISYLQYGTSERSIEEPVGTPVLRMANMQDEMWDLTKLKYLELSEKEKKSYLLKKGDLLFNRTNSKELVGKCTEFDLEGEYIFASYLIRVRLNTKKLLPQYVTAYLASNLGRMQIDAVSRQIAGMTNVNAEEIKDLLIPVPSVSKQKDIADKIDAAFKQKKERELESKKLLGSIDNYLLRELGICKPTIDQESITNRVFTRQFSELSGSRFSPSFHSEYNKQTHGRIKAGNYPLRKLKDVSIFQAGFAFSSGDYQENSNCKLITIKNIKANKIDVNKATYLPDEYLEKFKSYQVKTGDLLIAMTGATIGKVGLYEIEEKALLNQRNGVIKPDKVNTNYLMNLLNTELYQKVILKNSVGGAQPNISENEIMNIYIPVPPREKQEEIDKKIKEIRSSSNLLLEEAKDIVSRAKLEVEKLILEL